MNPLLIKTFDTADQRDAFLTAQYPQRERIHDMPAHYRLPDGVVLRVSETTIAFMK